jgi:hypothetical protein
MSEYDKEYWLHKDSEEAVNHLSDYHTKWTLWNQSPIRQAWVRNYLAYFSAIINPASWDTSQVYEGVQGELTKIYTPKARALIRQLITLISRQRMAFQAQAQSTGSDVMADVKLANGILDQIIDQQRMNLKGEDLLELAMVMGGAFTKTCWRTDKGSPYIVDNGKIIYTGEAEVSVHSVLDVFYEINYRDWDELTWCEVRTTKNRYDLIAQHPDLEDEILSIPSIWQVQGPNYWFDRTARSDELISVYEMYALPTPALPEGRMMMYSDEKTVYHDGPNIYKAIPIEPLMPEKVQGTLLGYPKISDIMASQEMLDNSLSAIATNQSQFAVQSVTAPRGSNINVQELNGMRFLSYTPQQAPGGGKPEPLQLSATAPETFKFSDLLDKNMSDLSGIHPILRGHSANITSGTMVATLTANAIEFLDSISKSYHTCLEKTMLHAVNCYKNFANIPQKLSVQGKNGQVYNKDFLGKDIENISGVKILVSNPVMQSIGGRLEIAEKLLQMPKELWPDYVSILEGKPLEDMTKGAVSQDDLIFLENEALTEGKIVPVLATDNHGAHVKAHSTLLNDPEIRVNGDRIEEILNHISEHVRLAEEVDPKLTQMIMTGQTPVPQPSAPEMAAQDEPDLGALVNLEVPPGEEGVLTEPPASPTDIPAQPAGDLLGRAT